MDWPIFIAAFLAPSIACFTLYLSLVCKSLSLNYSRVFKADYIASITSFGILLLNSSNCLLVVSYTLWASFFKSTNSLLFESSYLYCSACFNIFSIYSLERPPELWIVTEWSFPVDLSFALTWTIPFASISNVT